jgi:hypothetical protein
MRAGHRHGFTQYSVLVIYLSIDRSMRSLGSIGSSATNRQGEENDPFMPNEGIVLGNESNMVDAVSDSTLEFVLLVNACEE